MAAQVERKNNHTILSARILHRVPIRNCPTQKIGFFFLEGKPAANSRAADKAYQLIPNGGGIWTEYFQGSLIPSWVL